MPSTQHYLSLCADLWTLLLGEGIAFCAVLLMLFLLLWYTWQLTLRVLRWGGHQCWWQGWG